MPYSSLASVVIKAPLPKVWDAITLPEQVKEYFFGTDLVTDWKVGSPIFFRGEWEGKKYEDKGTILEFNPLKSLSYDYWSSLSGVEDKPELYQILRYELAETAEGTLLTIAQSNVPSQESADHSAENWQGVLSALKTFVENS